MTAWAAAGESAICPRQRRRDSAAQEWRMPGELCKGVREGEFRLALFDEAAGKVLVDDTGEERLVGDSLFPGFGVGEHEVKLRNAGG